MVSAITPAREALRVRITYKLLGFTPPPIIITATDKVYEMHLKRELI
jgi:hypothetical protein